MRNVSIILAIAISGCASGPSVRPRAAASTGNAPTVHEGEAVAFAARAIECMHGDADESECARAAAPAGVDAAALRPAQPWAVDSVGERVVALARHESMRPETRDALGRWVDLAAAAVREARAAHEGAMGHNVEACERTHDGHPDLEDLDSAASEDRRAVRAQSALRALATLANGAGQVTPEVTTTVLLVLRDRARIALGARPELRDDALATVAELARAVLGDAVGVAQPAANSGRAASASAHGSVDGASEIDAVMRGIAERWNTLEGRVTAPALRNAMSPAAH